MPSAGAASFLYMAGSEQHEGRERAEVRDKAWGADLRLQKWAEKKKKLSRGGREEGRGTTHRPAVVGGEKRVNEKGNDN